MDPDQALDELRAFTARVLNEQRLSQTDVERAAELFDGLDQWLSSRGFLPAPWRHDG